MIGFVGGDIVSVRTAVNVSLAVCGSPANNDGDAGVMVLTGLAFLAGVVVVSIVAGALIGALSLLLLLSSVDFFGAVSFLLVILTMSLILSGCAFDDCVTGGLTTNFLSVFSFMGDGAMIGDFMFDVASTSLVTFDILFLPFTVARL